MNLKDMEVVICLMKLKFYLSVTMVDMLITENPTRYASNRRTLKSDIKVAEKENVILNRKFPTL